MTNLLEKKKQKKKDFLSLNIILFLGEIILLLKRWKVIGPLHLWMRSFTLEQKCLMKILDKCKTHGDKRGLGHINKDETLSNREIIFVKRKKETPTK